MLSKPIVKFMYISFKHLLYQNITIFNIVPHYETQLFVVNKAFHILKNIFQI